MPIAGSYVQLVPFASTPSPPPVGSLLFYVEGTTLFLEDSSGNVYPFGSTSFISQLTGDVTAIGPGSAVATVQFVGGQSAAAVAAATIAYGSATSSNTANTLVLRDSSGNFSAGVITANVTGNVSGSAASFTGSLAGDVTGTQGTTAIASTVVTGKLLTGLTTGTNTPILATDSVLIAFEKLQAQTSASTGAAITALTGDVSAIGPGSAVATVNSVGGSTATNVHSAELAANAATALNTASTIVKRDASGNFAANVITASLTGNVTGNLVGNVTGNVSGSAASFTGSLAGDVTGTQGATVVGAIQGTTVNPTAPTDAQFLVYQTGITSYKAVSMSGAATMSDTGVVTLTNTSVTGQLLTGYATGSNTPITATNSIRTAFENLQAQIVATVGAAITSLTGDVTATGPGTATATVVAIQGHAVSATAPTDAQILIWNSGTSSWTPESMSGDVHITDLGVTSIVTTTNSTITTLSALSLPGSQVTGNIPGNAANITATTNSTLTTLTALALPTTQLTGTLQAAQFPALTGDVTTTAGSLVTHLVATTNSTLTTLSALSLPTTQLTGTLQAAQEPAHTGDVTNTAGSLVLSLVATTNSTLTTLTALSLPTTQLTGTLQAAQFPALTGDVTTTAGSLVTHLVATTNSTLTTLSALSLPGSQVTGNIAGNAANVTGVVAIVNGGTGQTTANAGFDALSPMTTLGDIIYENATPTAARLPGNTTTAREFLTSQGTGTLANAPSWSSLVSGDIPNNAANTSGTAANITATTNSTLTTLTALSLPTSQLYGTISAAQMLPLPTNDIYVGNGSNQPAAVAMSGDVNIVASGATTIQPNVVTNAKLAQMPADTLKGNNTGVTANAADLTVAQVNTMLGTVTSVTASSPLQSSGGATPNISFINQSANTILAGPTTGASAAPTFRALVSADIPPINLASTSNGGVTGALPIANGGTNSSTTLNNNRIMVSSGGAIVEAAALTNGQMLIGSTGAAPVAATLTAGTGISIANAAGSITITANGITPLVTKTANYTILSTDGTILCDTSGGAFTLTLPNPSGLSGQIWRVIDSTGFFQSNNLTLAPHGAEKIEGLAASKVLQTPWGWFNVVTDGVSWFVG